MKRALLPLAVLLAGLGFSTAARAQVYAAQPPTRGALYTDGQSGRYLLGGEWLTRQDLADVGIAQGWWRDVGTTDGWSPVTVPNAYNAGDFTSQSMGGWVQWYRRDFTLPASAFASYVPARDRRWIIRFETVNYSATVWLNGHPLGTHAGEYEPFELDLTGLRSGVNRLIVRVDNRRGADDLPPGPGGDWWNYGGILREVYLRAVQAVDISRVVVRPLLPCLSCAATISEQAVLRNLTSRAQTVTLSGTYGTLPLSFGTVTIGPGAVRTVAASTTVGHPRLWAPGHPALYSARFTLFDSRGRWLGGYSLQSGIRTIELTAGGRLTLNGRLLDLRGVSMQVANLAQGGALDVAGQRQLIDWVRQIGATLIRTHYPLPEQMEEMADRDGILIWSEIPVDQVAAAALQVPSWAAFAHSMLTSNILTNQNHPSVLLWSIGNELPSPATRAEATYIATSTVLAHRLDPTRPVGMATGGAPEEACERAYAPLDVIGKNEYFGWTSVGGGANDDRDALSPFLNRWRACYPRKALFITEFGFDANRAGPVEVRGTYAFQSNSIAFHLGVFARKKWLSGAIYWLLQDFAKAPGATGGNPWPDPPFITKGLVSLTGFIKPSFALVSSIYHATRQLGSRPG